MKLYITTALISSTAYEMADHSNNNQLEKDTGLVTQGCEVPDTLQKVIGIRACLDKVMRKFAILRDYIEHINSELQREKMVGNRMCQEIEKLQLEIEQKDHDLSVLNEQMERLRSSNESMVSYINHNR